MEGAIYKRQILLNPAHIKDDILQIDFFFIVTELRNLVVFKCQKQLTSHCN